VFGSQSLPADVAKKSTGTARLLFLAVRGTGSTQPFDVAVQASQGQ